MSIRDSWHGSREHDPTVVRASRSVHQFRSRRYAEDYELISDFETIGDWTLTTGDSIAVDTVNFKEGRQGIRWRSINGVDTTAEMPKSLNALGKHFEVWMYVDNIDNLARSRIDFEVAAPWAKWWYCLRLEPTKILSGWNHLGGLSKASFSSVGAPVYANWANITKVRFMVKSMPGTTVNVTFDDLRMIPDRYAGKVTLRFDDVYLDTYTEARSRMDEYGFRGVAAVYPSAVGVPGYMSLAQLKHLQERGWDIISHSMTHPHLLLLTSAEVENELWNSQRWLIENGFYKGSRFFVPPYHEVNLSVLEQINKHYLAVQYRIGRHDTIPPSPYQLDSLLGIDGATPLATVQAHIDAVKESQAWTTFLFHDISGMLPLFQDIIDYIAASGLEVVTFSDVFDELIGIKADYTQLLELGVQGAITVNATSYPCPGGGVAAQTANEIKIPVSRDGWLKNLRVRQRVASGGAGLTDIYTVRVNGADTGLTCTLNNVTIGSDLVHSVNVNPGDEVSVKLVSNNVADTSADISVTVELELLM